MENHSSGLHNPMPFIPPAQRTNGPSSSGLEPGRTFVPKSQRGIQRLLDEHADTVIGSAKLDAAIDAAIAFEITASELRTIIRDIERGIAV